MPTEDPRLDLTIDVDGALVLAGEIDSYTAPEPRRAPGGRSARRGPRPRRRDVHRLVGPARARRGPPGRASAAARASCCGHRAPPCSGCSRSAASPATSTSPADPPTARVGQRFLVRRRRCPSHRHARSRAWRRAGCAARRASSARRSASVGGPSAQQPPRAEPSASTSLSLGRQQHDAADEVEPAEQGDDDGERAVGVAGAGDVAAHDEAAELLQHDEQRSPPTTTPGSSSRTGRRCAGSTVNIISSSAASTTSGGEQPERAGERADVEQRRQVGQQRRRARPRANRTRKATPATLLDDEVAASCIGHVGDRRRAPCCSGGDGAEPGPEGGERCRATSTKPLPGSESVLGELGADHRDLAERPVDEVVAQLVVVLAARCRGPSRTPGAAGTR